MKPDYMKYDGRKEEPPYSTENDNDLLSAAGDAAVSEARGECLKSEKRPHPDNPDAVSKTNDVNAVVSFAVTEKAMRPASDKRQCFYCHQQIGELHKPGCVLINKKVKIRTTVEYEVEVPASWGKEQIEFHRNDGSWCANNAINELDRIFGNDNGPCMCGSAEFEYLGGDSEPYLDE